MKSDNNNLSLNSYQLAVIFILFYKIIFIIYVCWYEKQRLRESEDKERDMENKFNLFLYKFHGMSVKIKERKDKENNREEIT